MVAIIHMIDIVLQLRPKKKDAMSLFRTEPNRVLCDVTAKAVREKVKESRMTILRGIIVIRFKLGRIFPLILHLKRKEKVGHVTSASKISSRNAGLELSSRLITSQSTKIKVTFVSSLTIHIPIFLWSLSSFWLLSLSTRSEHQLDTNKSAAE